MGNDFKGNELDQLFILHGKPATDSGLYPWALSSLGKAFLFYAETVESRASKPLRGISAYYTLFHLGMFTMLTAPKFIDPNVRRAINKELKGGSADPSRSVRHVDVNKFLKEYLNKGLPNEIVKLFEKTQKTRDFINYGPRVYWKEPDDPYIDTCEIQPDNTEEIIEKLKESFVSTIDWVCLKGEDDGIWIPILLEQTAKFFNKTNGFYKDWISEPVRQKAEMLRAQLYKMVLEKRNKKQEK